jgi:acyl-CoA synthetase (AMP-forming)/AMP-acid ligase II
VSLGDIPRRNARRFPRREGLVFGDVRHTWSQVDERVNRLASALSATGMRRGDRVAILAQNDHRYLESYWALAKAGIVAVPLNYRLVERELTQLLDHSQASGLIFGPGYEDVSAQLLGRIPGLTRGVSFGARVDFARDYEDLLSSGSPREPAVGVADDDPFAIMYTSGTTGLPKGAVVTHGNLENNVYNQAIADKADSDDVNLTATPLYHMGALFMATTYTYLGCTNIILETFDPAEVQQAIQRERATVCLLIPTMLNMVLNDKEFGRHDLSSLRLIFYGGSIMPVPVLRRAMETIGCSFTQGYGLTETIEATFLTMRDHVLDDPERERRLGSAGREAPNAEVRVVDDDGRDVGDGEIGEVLVRSRSVIPEYWRAPDETAATIREGWFHTGDVGFRDDDGYLFIVDRKKDVIISGGTNIYPKEIEEVLYGHPAVVEAAVIGIPDEMWGEAVKAVVVKREGSDVTAEELIELCRANLAGYKKPRSVEFVDALPRNPSGKILKRELRAQYDKEHAEVSP